jgi:hypothetical protein
MKLSDRLARQQSFELDTRPLRAALRKLRQALEHKPHPTYLFVEGLAKRSTIAIATLEHGDDGVKVTLKPARELAMFLKRVK